MMHFSQIWGLLALVSVPLIILLYAFRPRRLTMLVSSNRLWREALRERQRGLGLQKLLRDLGLLLLLLFAVALSLGLAGLGWSTHSTEHNDIVLVIDVSASMQARSASGSTRLQVAKQQARQIIDGLDRHARLLLMSSGRHSLLQTAFESDRPTLERALDQLEPTDETGNPRQALSLALSLLRSRRQGRVYFISDGAFDKLGDLDTSRIEFRLIEGLNENVAITRFDIRPEIGTELRHQILVTARNFTDTPVVTALNISIDNKALVNQTLQLAGNEKRVLVLPVEGRISGAVKASLAFGDDFSRDNTAYAVVAEAASASVLVVGPENLYIESVLAALPNLVVNRILEPGPDFPSQAVRHDIVVLDRVPDTQLPESLPAGNYLLLDTLPAGLPFSGTQQVDQPEVSGNTTGAVLADIDLQGLEISRARKIGYSGDQPGIQRLFWSADTDLALAFVDSGVRLVLLGFDLSDSNFPLLASFPVFLSESLSWLQQYQHRVNQTQMAAGQAVSWPVTDTESDMIIETPSGKTVQSTPSAGRYQFQQTAVAGIYRYKAGQGEGQFAINLTSESESDIRSRIEVPVVSSPVSTAQLEGRVDKPLWPWLVLLALFFLTLEWCLWCWRGSGA